MAEKTLYNPASLREEDLIANFVVRTKTFERIFKDIRNSNMRYPEKHYLIQGQRGMGKTTLLLRLKYEVERTESLNSWLVPVFFNEESYDINNLSSLWEKLLKYLDDYFDTDGAYYDYTEQFVEEEDYERLCFNYLIEKLHERGKKLIIFFDNFGELFLDNLREKEKRRFREILINCSDIRIIGASAVVINDLHDYSQPFFEFFQIIHLDGLNKEETYELIAKLQEDCPETRQINLKKHRAKIDTLAVLTGGVIRTIMMLYQVLLDDPNGKALEDLEKVLDKITPLYKHRIEDLPLQQRRIVDVIAKKWDAVSAKEIAAEIREDGRKMSTKLISAQLAQLEKNNVVEKKATTTKNHLYQLKERFFNIWYLMRNGDRRDRKRVAWLTKFLEVWYDDDDSFDAFVKNHIQSLRSGKYIPSSALLIAEALVNSDKIDPKKLDGLIEETSAILKEEEGRYLPDLFNNRKLAVAHRKYEAGEYAQAVEVLNSISNPNNFVYLMLVFYYVENSQFENARIALRNISGINSSELKFFAALCMELKEYDFLLDEIQNSHELDSAVKSELYGMAYLKKENYLLAQTYLIEAISLGDFDIKSALVEALEHTKDVEGLTNQVLSNYESGRLKAEDVVELFVLIQDRIGVDEKMNAKTATMLLDLDKTARVSYWSAVNKHFNNYMNDKDDDVIEELEEAVSLFEEEGDRDSVYYRRVLSDLMIYHILVTLDRDKANDVFEKMTSLGTEEMWPTYSVVVDLWNYRYDNIYNKIVESNLLDVRDGNTTVLSHILLLLLARRQYHTVYNLFQYNKSLQNTVKPIYYALMTLMQDELPNEILKMGDELKIPVEEILQKVEQMKVDYK